MKINYVLEYHQKRTTQLHSAKNIKKTLEDHWYVLTKPTKSLFSLALLLRSLFQHNMEIQDWFALKGKWFQKIIIVESMKILKAFIRIFLKIKDGFKTWQVLSRNLNGNLTPIASLWESLIVFSSEFAYYYR